MSKELPLIHDAETLSEALRQAEGNAPKGSVQCSCSLARCAGWDAVTESAWPKSQLTPLATLRDSLVDEPTFEEYQPSGVRVDDPRAQISVEHFPYNRCDVYACNLCKQGVMRYTEYGGYYIDHRARRVHSDQVIKPKAAT
jgi:hypothetical protein